MTNSENTPTNQSIELVRPDVSVVVPCKDALPWLEQLIASILSQKVNLEVIVVDDMSTDGSFEYIQNLSKESSRIRQIRGEGRGPGAARNLGVKHARGRYLVFADADDLVLPHAYMTMLGTLEKTGSDFVVGKYQRHTVTGEIVQVQDSIKAHHGEKLAIPGSEAVEGVLEPVLWNKMFRMEFWDQKCSPIPEAINYEDQPPVFKALAETRSCDFIDEAVYSWRISEVYTSRSSSKGSFDDVKSRLAVSKIISGIVSRPDNSKLRSALVQRWVNRDFPMYVDFFSKKESDDPYLGYLAEWAKLIINTAASCKDPWALTTLRQRLNVYVAAYARPNEVEDLLGIYQESRFNIPLDLTTGSISKLFDLKLPVAKHSLENYNVQNMLRVMPQDITLNAEAISSSTDGNTLTLKTQIWISNADELTLQDFEICLESDNQSIPLKARQTESPFLKWRVQSKWWDYNRSNFTISIPHTLINNKSHQIKISLNSKIGEKLGFGVSDYIKISSDFNASTEASGITITKGTSNRINIAKPPKKRLPIKEIPVLQNLIQKNRKKSKTKFTPGSCGILTGIEPVSSSRILGANDFKFSGRLKNIFTNPGINYKLVAYNSASRVETQLILLPNNQFQAMVPAESLQLNRAYSIQLFSDTGNRIELKIDNSIDNKLIYGEYRTLDVRVRGQNLVVFAKEPRNLSLMTRWGQSLLSRARSINETILFESFEGKSVWDNPGAIASYLVSQGAFKDIQLYMSIASIDLLKDVPAGIIPVLYGSDTWFNLLSTSKVIVTNNNLPVWFSKAKGQTWLQTWHGTPIKKLLWDAKKTFIGLAYRRLMERQVPEWDLLLAQNDHAASLLRESMHYSGPVLVGEYPRNIRLIDALSRRDSVKEQLGISAESTVVLWAPTWRYSQKKLEFPLNELTQHPDLTVLVRGHHMELLDIDSSVDCTNYPYIEDLLAVADILVTDYSSVAYDYLLTQGTLLFYAPDIEYYSEVDRGLYQVWPYHPLDAAVCQTSSELLTVILKATKGNIIAQNSKSPSTSNINFREISNFIEKNFWR